jgi:hypothetical protein
MSLKEIPGKIPKYYCEKCETGTGNKKDFSKHLATAKHKKIHGLTNIEPNLTEKSPLFVCKECDMSYKSRVGLWYHSKKCGKSQKPHDYMTVITQLLNQNNELKNFIIEQATEHKKDTMELVGKMIENVKPVNTTNNNTINNNHKFNINVFLNDQCKDAINFADFVKNIEVSHADIQNTGQLGFVDGISKIILDNLKQLSINERPIHCTDLKRETMYIKDEDKWNREENDTKLRNAIQTVSRKSIKTLQDWKQINPDYNDGNSDFSLECLSMQRHSVAGEDRDVYFPKVAKLVAKEVIIDKT